MACDSFSASRKTARAVLVWQSIGQVIYGLSSFVLKGYSGAVQSVVSLLRNTVAIANIKSRSGVAADRLRRCVWALFQ